MSGSIVCVRSSGVSTGLAVMSGPSVDFRGNEISGATVGGSTSDVGRGRGRCGPLSVETTQGASLCCISGRLECSQFDNGYF